MKWYNKGLIIAVLAFIIANPLTGQVILQGINILFDLIFTYGFYISVAGAVYITAYLIFTIYRGEKVNIPAKTKKTKAKYIDVK